VLNYAISANPADANACYYLGCLYYDRFRWDEAVSLWEECIRRDSTHAKALRNLALAYFDKRGDAASARVCMERALEYRKDPRLLFEYQQLLKNTNVSVAERLDVYAQYPELLAERDDCYLDRIVLLCQQGRYAEAIHAARIKRFHIYEGGEGNLTKQHAWMHVLHANELAFAGRTEEARQVYMDGVNMPKSYGEAKTWFNQEAHIFYYLGCLLDSQGQTAEAQKAFEDASVYKAAVSELSMFRALALRKLLRFSEAQQVLNEMLASGTNLLVNKDLRSYYGVGSPSPMPFEYDIGKVNSVNGHILRGYALLGLGRRDEAAQEIAQAASWSPNDFRIYAFHQVKDTF
jgi:tetratricopeptide (TPR) repeat protein